MKFLRRFAMLLCLCLLMQTSGSFLTKSEQVIGENPDVGLDNIRSAAEDGYREIVRNQYNILYADMSNGLFAVKSLKTGDIWYSVPPDSENDTVTSGLAKTNVRSQIVIDYLYTEEAEKATELQTSNSYLECVDYETVYTKAITNGIMVTYNFEDLGFVIPVTYTIEQDSFYATIQYDDIQEGKDAILLNIQVLPSFGAGTANDTGYLVVPDGSGAIIQFNNKKNNVDPYEKKIYGEEIDTSATTKTTVEESINMPVFGIVKNNSAMVGIIVSGDDNAAICAGSGNAKNAYNSISSKLIYRCNSPTTMFADTFAFQVLLNKWIKYVTGKEYRVCYRFLNAEQASYSGIAQAYRDYLVNQDILTKRVSAPTFHIDIYGGVDTVAAFLGLQYSKLTTLSSYSEMQKLMESLHEAGVNDISARLIGWSNDGVSNKKIPDHVKLMSALGGKRQYDRLMDYAAKNNVSITNYVDFTYHKYGKSSNAIKTNFNKYIYKYDYLCSVYSRINDSKKRIATIDATKNAAAAFLKSFKKYNGTGISIGDLGSFCYTDFSSKKITTRGEFISSLQGILKQYRSEGIAVTLDDANAYTFGYVNTITNAPSSSSGYKIFDGDIPLYQLVLHGYINMTGEPLMQTDDYRLSFLNLVETGRELLYSGIFRDAAMLESTKYNHLYSSTYSYWNDIAIEQYQAYQSLLSETYDQPIASHKECSKNVMETIYSDGLTVYVNYNPQDVVVDGIQVPAMDFMTVKR